MKALLLLLFIVYANAQLLDFSNGIPIHLGPFDTSVHIGNLTKRYTPVHANDNISSRNARELVEEARRMFNVGFNVLPPLDPYARSSLPPFSVDNYVPLVGGSVHLNNLVVTGAQRFKLNLLELRLETGRVDFGFDIPLLNVNVDLQLDLLIGDLIPVHFKGHVSLLLKGVKIIGAVHVVPKGLTTPTTIGKKYYFQLEALHSRMHIDDIGAQLVGSQIDISNIIKDNSFFNAESDNSLVKIIDKLLKNLNNYIADIVIQQANHMLLIANTEQVLAYLLPNVKS